MNLNNVMVTVILTVSSDSADIGYYKNIIGTNHVVHTISTYQWCGVESKSSMIEKINKIIAESDSTSDIMLLSDRIVIHGEFDDFLKKMTDCLYLTEKHAIVYGQDIENKIGMIHTLNNFLPKYSITVRAKEDCVLIKRDIINQHGVLDTQYQSIHYALMDFYYRINAYGYSSLTAHYALYFYDKFFKQTKFLEDEKIFLSKYPYSEVNLEKYDKYGVNTLINYLPILDESYYGKKRILFDCSIMPPRHCGTSEYQIAIFEAFNRLYKDKYDIFMLITEEACKYHKLDEMWDNILFPDTITGVFNLGFAPNQISIFNQISTLNKHCLKIIQTMFDIIMVRADEHFSKIFTEGDLNSFALGVEISDGINFISQYSKNDFMARFGERVTVDDCMLKVIYPAAVHMQPSKTVYELPLDDYILLVGNNLKHKAITEAMEAVKDSKQNYIVVGSSSDGLIAANVFCYSGGMLEDDFISFLYENCKAILFPSYYEGFGFPLVSALKLNKTIIARDNELNRELKVHFGVAAECFVFFRDLKEINELVENIDLSKTVADSTYEDTWDRVANECEAFFSEVLEQPINFERLSRRINTSGIIVANQFQIEYRDSIIKYRDSIIADINLEIAGRDAEISEKALAIDDLKDKVLELYDAAAESEAAANERNVQIMYKNESIELLECEVEVLRAYGQAIENAFWWRITKPARTFTRAIKWIARKFPLTRPVYHRLLEKRNEARFPRDIKISIITPLYNTDEKFLQEMIESVQCQTYKNWELCLADGSEEQYDYIRKLCEKYAKRDSRINYRKLDRNFGISGNTNKGIELATGDYIGLLDHDDLLHSEALMDVMGTICEQNADFIYTDEALFSESKDSPVHIHYKPDFSIDYLRSVNYICHFSCFSRELLDKAGWFNTDYSGSQDHDLILRLTENAKTIVHIPKILYYWRMHEISTAGKGAGVKPYAIDAAKRAIADHLNRVGIGGTVESAGLSDLPIYRVKYELNDNPLVSIIIPNKDHIDDLRKCIDSIFTISTYRNYEIIIVENNSNEESTFDYYDKIRSDTINIVKFDGIFNFSKINNYARKFAKGDYLLFLNNDIEVITPNWLEEMLMFAQREDVGAVGAKLYYPDDTIQHAGVILGIGGIAGHSHKYFSKQDPGYMYRLCLTQNLSAVTAACLMMRSDVFDEISGFNEELRVAFNDVDLCMRIRKAGYLIAFTPYAELYHHESKSRGYEDTPEKQARFVGEVAGFKLMWNDVLKQGDPYYNPNLTLEHENFEYRS